MYINKQYHTHFKKYNEYGYFSNGVKIQLFKYNFEPLR